ncbi:hypothetical protein [Haloarcula salina]|nr:hypothetical protein [Haloarcula salina]
MAQNTAGSAEVTDDDHEPDGGHVIHADGDAADYLKAAIDSRW